MHNPLKARLVVSDALVLINGADIEQIQQDTNEIGVATVIMAQAASEGKIGYKVKMDTTDIEAYYESCSKGAR